MSQNGSGLIQRYYYPEKEEVGQVVQVPRNAYLHISSQDRYLLDKNGNYINNPAINPNNIFINHQKLTGFGYIRRVGVTEISFPWTTPNVNKFNNIFYVQDGSGVQYQCSIDGDINAEGFFDASGLAVALQNALNQFLEDGSGNPAPAPFGNNDWTVVYDPTSFSYGIEKPLPFSTNVTNPASTKNLNYMTGVAGLTAEAGPPPTYGLFGGVPDLNYTRYIDFVSTNLSQYEALKDNLTQFNYTNIIYRLYLEDGLNLPNQWFGTAPHTCVYRQVSNPKYFSWMKDQMMGQIDIQLYDDAGRLLYIPQGSWNIPYYLTIHVSES